MSLESSPPSCPSPPRLLVWMNVSSLTPWFSDFHTVQFSGRSGCFFVFEFVVALLLVVRRGTVCLPMPPSSDSCFVFLCIFLNVFIDYAITVVPFPPPLPTSKLGPSGADSPGGWVCVCSRPLWVSPMNSPVRLGVSLAAATPTGVFNQRL